MDNLLQQIINILVTAPGNLIYHLTLAFSVFASLQSALIGRRGSQNGRALLGLNLILVAQLALFLVSGLAWQGVISSHLFLPLFDRAVIVFSLIWIGWLWAFPEKNTIADVATGVLNLAVVVLFFFTYNQWALEGSQLAFNGTWEDWTFAFSGVGVVVVALVAVIVRRPDGWGFGFGMALLNLAGLLAHLFLNPAEGDFGGFLRLAQLAAYPLLPGLMTRQGRAALIPTVESGSETPAAPRVPRVADPRTIHAWVDLNLKNEPAQVCTGIARAIAQSLLADLCYVVTSPNEGYSHVILQGGYDLIREEEVAGTLLEQTRVPALTAALQKARGQRLLSAEARTPDLKSLAEALGLKDVGNALILPLTHNGAPWGGLLLLSPYSNRVWAAEDPNYLAAESESITAILMRAQTQADQRLETQHARETLTNLTREAESLRQQNQQLVNDIANLRAAVHAPSTSQDMEALLAVQQETQDALSFLQSENTRLKALLARSAGPMGGSDVAQMENELRTVLQEVARLQNALIQSNSRVLELERSNTGQSSEHTNGQYTEFTSLLQDMRQPMSSIMGYTDLLLAESLGILGKGQRNFVERIRSSAERLRALIDSLANLSADGETAVENASIAVDINEIIDQAVAEISPQLFERNVQLHVDLPDQLPGLYADRDSLQQIVGHLLENAGNVSPAEGSIGLRARLWHEENTEYVILQVTDSGGGIANEDLPRVFARHYADDRLPVSGTGDNGVGLALTKTLTIAMGGRIWVESIPGRTTTFTVLMPIHPPASGQLDDREKPRA